ncbi:MAG: alpha/beta hydrolase [Gammaproteobacteria bacterium]|nr:alpha/beta hydrolase [Gammaproteobacteria bacterium]
MTGRVMGSLPLAILLLLLFSGLLYLQQPAMIFFPARALVANPADWGLEYEEVGFAAADGKRLHGWYLPADGSRHTLLFFHGNAGNISHRGESLRIFHRLGLNVLIFDYRGYGRSEGQADEQGLYRDAQAAWRYLAEQRGEDPGEIVLFGRSLGGAVAARLAAQVQPAGLLLESSFSSARDLAQWHFPLLSRLTPLRYRFDAVASLEQVSCPVLVLHSPQDEIIPYVLGEKLFRAAAEPKQFLPLQGDHNSGFVLSQPGYEQGIRAFLAKHVYPAEEQARDRQSRQYVEQRKGRP